jgi:hypothetical protein
MKKKLKTTAKKTQSVSCNFRVAEVEYWEKKGFRLPAYKTYVLIIDYPFDKEGYFPINTGKGMGVLDLLPHIYEAYKEQYRDAKKNKNGYWHGIGDLFVEGIKVNHQSKKITLEVGS